MRVQRGDKALTKLVQILCFLSEPVAAGRVAGGAFVYGQGQYEEHMSSREQVDRRLSRNVG